MQLHVARALEFLEDDVVHAAAGLDERRRQDGDRAAFLDVSCGTEKLLGLVQRRRVQTAGQRAPAGRLHQVVRPRQAGDGIHQDDDVLAVLHEPLRPGQHHLRHLHVVGRLLVERGVDHLALDLALHVRDLLGPLVDQQHDQLRVHVLVLDGLRDLLQQRRLAGLRRGNDQPALTLPDRRHQVGEPHGQRAAAVLQADALGGIDGRQVGEIPAADGDAGLVVVDRLDVEQRAETLVVAGLSRNAADLVAGLQVETADLRRGHVDILVGRQEVVEAQEAETAFRQLQDAGLLHAAFLERRALFRVGFRLLRLRGLFLFSLFVHAGQELHDLFLLQALRVRDPQRRGNLAQFRDFFIL